MAEQVSEAHDGVLSVLDQMLLGSVTDVLIISCSLHVRGEQTYHLFTGIGDSTRNLPLSILVGDTDWVALFVNDSDGSVRLAKVDTENGGTGSPRDELDSDTLCLHFIYDRDGLRDLVKKVRRFFVSFKLSRVCGTRIPGDGPTLRRCSKNPAGTVLTEGRTKLRRSHWWRDQNTYLWWHPCPGQCI